MPLPCDIEVLEEHVQDLVANSYSVCDSEVPVELSPEDLEIVETGTWCSWQPTYEVVTPPGDPIGLDPTHPGTVQITTLIKDYVYDKLMNDFDAYKNTLEGNIAVNYTSKVEYSDEWSAYSGQMNASYAQLADGTAAQVSTLQTAIADQSQALSTLVSETQAQFQDGLLAATNLYQQSYSTATEAMAAVGATAWLTDPVTGKSVLSGFKATASSNSGSEFAVFADNFYIATGTISGDGIEIEALHKPFQVVGNTVYIGEVDTSKPQITYLGEYASAPVTTQLSAVYKNTTDGNSYIWNGTGWVVWLTSGAAGLPGAAGIRGSAHINVSGVYDGNPDAAFINSSGYYDRVIGDWVTYTGNSSTGAVDYYRTANNSTSFVQASLYVNGNLIATGTIYANAIAAGTITVDKISSTAFSAPGYSGAIFAPGYASSVLYLKGGTSNGIAVLQVDNQNSNLYLYPVSVSSWSGGGLSVDVSGTQNTGSYSSQIVNSRYGSGLYIASTTYGVKVLGGVAPFTGAHESVYLSSLDLKVGDIVRIVTTIGKSTISDTLHEVTVTTTSSDKGVFGVVAVSGVRIYDEYPLVISEMYHYIEEIINDDDEVVETSTLRRRLLPEFEDLPLTHHYAAINSIGEGMLNVCDANGDIEIGDYVCSSDVTGKGMKQDDDLLHSYTVAKVLENIVWNDEVIGENGCFEQDGHKCKMVVCTYHCG